MSVLHFNNPFHSALIHQSRSGSLLPFAVSNVRLEFQLLETTTMQTKMTLSTSVIVTLLALSSPFIHPVRAAKPASLETSSQGVVDSYATSSTDYSSPS